MCFLEALGQKANLLSRLQWVFSFYSAKRNHLLTWHKHSILSTFSELPSSIGRLALWDGQARSRITQPDSWRKRPLKPKGSPKVLVRVTHEPGKHPHGCVLSKRTCKRGGHRAPHRADVSQREELVACTPEWGPGNSAHLGWGQETAF